MCAGPLHRQRAEAFETMVRESRFVKLHAISEHKIQAAKTRNCGSVVVVGGRDCQYVASKKPGCLELEHDSIEHDKW